MMRAMTWLNRKNDTTDRRHTQQMINQVAEHDYLTNLPNRRAFEQQISIKIHNMSNHLNLAILILSFNRFKFINETLGHASGDKLIQYAAHRIRLKVPEECFIARTNGDEFSILIPYVKEKDLLDVVNSVLDIFEEPIQVEQFSVYITAGAGIGLYPTHGTDPETLLKNTSIALRHAKKIGQNNFLIYTPTLNVGPYNEFTLFNEFKKALSQGNFVLYYQPRVDTSTGEIVAAEALIRWEHPDWGLVSPAEFIQLAEETGFISSLGEWVIRAVCRQLYEWKARFQNIKISLNVSPKQLIYPDFVQIVDGILHEFHIQPGYIEFEVTETSIIPNDSTVMETIKQLRHMGIAIFYDDFGTGYSSLNWLSQFQLDGIKLDKSSIEHIPQYQVPTQIVKSMIQLAHSLNLTVVAEGVETDEQLLFLKNENCQQVQGFLYSTPVPVEEFEKLLRVKILKPTSTRHDQQQLTNRRKHFRVEFRNPLIGKVTIVSVQSKKLSLGYTDVLIMDIGPGGLRFASNLRFPVKQGVLLNFTIRMLGKIVKLEGSIVWARGLSDNIFQYGVELLVDEVTRDKLVFIFNDLAIKLQSGIAIPNTNFFTQDLNVFFP